MNLKAWRKGMMAGAGVFAVLGQILADGTVTGPEWGLLATAVSVAVGVLVLRNGDKPTDETDTN